MCLKTRHWHQHATVAEKVLAFGSSKHFNARFTFCQTALIRWFLQRAWFSVLKEGQRKKLPFLWPLPVHGVWKTSQKLPEVGHGRVFLWSTKLICLGAGSYPGSQLITSSSACNWENLPVRLLGPCWQYWPLKNISEGFSSLNRLPFSSSLLFLLASLSLVQGILTPWDLLPLDWVSP